MTSVAFAVWLFSAAAALVTSQASEIVCNLNFDLILILDESGSVLDYSPFNESDPYRNWNLSRKYARRLAGNFGVGRTNAARLAVIRFSGEATIQIGLSSYSSQAEVVHSIDSMQFRGGLTDISAALRAVDLLYVNGTVGRRRRYVVILTDGIPTVNANRTRPAAQRLKQREDTSLLAIGVGEEVDAAELRAIASDDDHVLLVDDYARLDGTVPAVQEKICGENSSVYIIECSKKMDVVFVLDASSSITRDHHDGWTDAKRFTVELMRRMSAAEPGNTRVALLLFETNVTVVSQLDTHSNVKDLIEEVEQLQYTGGDTYTHDALRTVRENVFLPSLGDRSDAVNVLLLITDGRSINVTATEHEATLLKNANVTLLVVGVTNNTNEAECKLYASDPPDEHYFFHRDFRSLAELEPLVVKSVCTSYPLDNKPQLRHRRSSLDQPAPQTP